MSCMFQSCASSPDNTKSIKAQAPAEPEMRIMVKRKLTVGGLIGCLASVPHYHKKKESDFSFCWKEHRFFFLFFPTCNFFVEYDSRFSVAPFQHVAKQAPKRRQHTPSLSQQNDTTLRSASEQLVYVCRWHEILPRSSIQRCMFMVSPLDLCYANQDLH